MQNDTNLRHAARLIPLAAAALLVATGCGSTTSTTSSTASSPVARTATAAAPSDAPETIAVDPTTTDTPTEGTATADTAAAPTTVAPPTSASPAPASTIPTPTIPTPTIPTPTVPTPTIPTPTIPTPTIPVPTVFEIPTPAPTPCGSFGDVPATATITSDLAVALDADGIVDDQIITYQDGVDTLRSVRNGVVSEFVVPDVGVSHIRALGVGNVAEISRGNEVIVRTGGGLSSAYVGLFGHDDAGCLFEFTRYGQPFEMEIGETSEWSAGAYCAESFIAQWEYHLEDDGTYVGSSSAFFESSPGDFTYLPASDDFSEGLSAADLSPASLDCFDFGL